MHRKQMILITLILALGTSTAHLFCANMAPNEALMRGENNVPSITITPAVYLFCTTNDYRPENAHTDILTALTADQQQNIMHNNHNAVITKQKFIQQYKTTFNWNNLSADLKKQTLKNAQKEWEAHAALIRNAFNACMVQESQALASVDNSSPPGHQSVASKTVKNNADFVPDIIITKEVLSHLQSVSRGLGNKLGQFLEVPLMDSPEIAIIPASCFLDGYNRAHPLEAELSKNQKDRQRKKRSTIAHQKLTTFRAHLAELDMQLQTKNYKKVKDSILHFKEFIDECTPHNLVPISSVEKNQPHHRDSSESDLSDDEDEKILITPDIWNYWLRTGKKTNLLTSLFPEDLTRKIQTRIDQSESVILVKDVFVGLYVPSENSLQKNSTALDTWHNLQKIIDLTKQRLVQNIRTRALKPAAPVTNTMPSMPLYISITQEAAQYLQKKDGALCSLLEKWLELGDDFATREITYGMSLPPLTFLEKYYATQPLISESEKKAAHVSGIALANTLRKYLNTLDGHLRKGNQTAAEDTTDQLHGFFLQLEKLTTAESTSGPSNNNEEKDVSLFEQKQSVSPGERGILNEMMRKINSLTKEQETTEKIHHLLQQRTGLKTFVKAFDDPIDSLTTTINEATASVTQATHRIAKAQKSFEKQLTSLQEMMTPLTGNASTADNTSDAQDLQQLEDDQKELEHWRICRQTLNSDKHALTPDDLYLLKKRSTALSQQEKRLLDTLLDEQPVRRVKATPAAKFGIFTPIKNDHDQPKKKKNNKNKNTQKKKQSATVSHQSTVATREPAPEKVAPLPSYSPLDRAAIDETNALVTASLMKKIQAHKLNSLPLVQNNDESAVAHQEPVDEEKEKPAQNNVPQKLFLDPETPLLFAKVVRDHYLTQEDYAKALQTGKVTQQQFNGCYRLGSKTMFPRLSLDYLVDQLREGFDNNIAHAAEQRMRDGTYRTIFETTITNPDIADIRYNQIPVRYVLVKDNNYRKIISVYPLIPKSIDRTV